MWTATHFTIVNRPQYKHASGGLEYETAYALGAGGGGATTSMRSPSPTTS